MSEPALPAPCPVAGESAIEMWKVVHYQMPVKLH